MPTVLSNLALGIVTTGQWGRPPALGWSSTNTLANTSAADAANSSHGISRQQTKDALARGPATDASVNVDWASIRYIGGLREWRRLFRATPRRRDSVLQRPYSAFPFLARVGGTARNGSTRTSPSRVSTTVTAPHRCVR